MAKRRRSTFQSAFGQAVRAARIERGLSQRELAEAAAIADKYLSRVEIGAVTPSVHVAYRIAQALGASLDALTRNDAETAIDPRVRNVMRALRRLRPEDVDRALRVLTALLR